MENLALILLFRDCEKLCKDENNRFFIQSAMMTARLNYSPVDEAGFAENEF